MATEQQTHADTLAPGGEWRLDPAGSVAAFTIRKVFWRPSGRFQGLSGTLRARTGSFELAGSAPVASIRTGVGLRDRHLRSSHFFGAAQNPNIDLAISDAAPIGNGAYRLCGQLTLKGVTRPIELIAAAHAHDEHLHVHAAGSIDRHAHGLVAPAFVELGGLMLGREVEIEIDALFRRSD